MRGWRRGWIWGWRGLLWLLMETGLSGGGGRTILSVSTGDVSCFVLWTGNASAKVNGSAHDFFDVPRS